MIDIHSHILPGIDDGAKNLEESISMAEKASKQGVEKIIATPHYIENESPPQLNLIYQKTDKLQKMLNKREINIEILPGAEVYLTPLVGRELEAGNICGLNETDYLLVELPMNHFPNYLENVLNDIQIMGYTPVIGHPERYHTVKKNPQLLSKWIKRGAKIQLNSGSLIGKYGKMVEKTAEEIIKKGLVHLIGSDSHSDSQKRGTLQAGMDRLSDLIGDQKTVFYQNAERLIKGEKLITPNPPAEKKTFLKEIKALFKK